MSEGTLLIAVGAAAVIALGAGRIVHRLDAANLAKVEAGYSQAQAAATAQAAALQKAQDQITLSSAVAEASSQTRIITRTSTLIQKVPTYVTVQQDRACVSYGLVRVLDAAVHGVDPSELQLPAGQSDDACSPVKASDLARSVAGNYGVAHQNAEQLTALQADVSAKLATIPAQQKTLAPVKKPGLLKRLFGKKS